MKIVINECYGGFSVSRLVYAELGIKYDGFGYIDNEDLGIKNNNNYAYRADKRLIKAIEKIGLEESSGKLSELRIVEIPNGIKWEIDEYDGMETIHEKHRSW